MKKGFTLIEIMGIIVILSILVLIATPFVGKVVEKTSIKSAILSAYGYVDSIDDTASNLDLSGEPVKLEGRYTVNGDAISGVEDITINMGGNKPSGGFLIYQDSVLKDACLIIKGYEVRYDGKSFISKGKGDCTNLTFAYYYTFFDNGTRSEIYYNEEDIPSSWTYYIKTIISEEKTRYYADDQIRKVTDKNKSSIYTDLRECELDNNLCIPDISWKKFNGEYGLLVGYELTKFTKDSTHASGLETYDGLECNYSNDLYILYEDDPRGNVLKSDPLAYFSTLEACENNLNGRSTAYSCKKEAGYICTGEGSFIADTTKEQGFGYSCDYLNGYTSHNLDGISKVTSCNYISAIHYNFNSYMGSFASASECNAYIDNYGNSAIRDIVSCVPYSGYTQYILKNGNKEWFDNYKSLGSCEFDANYYKYSDTHYCMANEGYAIKFNYITDGFSADGDNTCEMMNKTLSYEGYGDSKINSCSYDYIADTEATPSYRGINLKAIKSYDDFGPAYDTLDECLNNNLICYSFKSSVDETSYYIITKDNEHIEYFDDYEKTKASFDQIYGEGVELSTSDEDGSKRGTYYVTADPSTWVEEFNMTLQEFLNLMDTTPDLTADDKMHAYSFLTSLSLATAVEDHVNVSKITYQSPEPSYVEKTYMHSYFAYIDGSVYSFLDGNLIRVDLTNLEND